VIVSVVVCASATSRAAADDASTPRTVVIVLPGSDDPGYAVTSAAIREAVQARPDIAVDCFREYLSLEHVDPDRAALALRDGIRRKYEGRAIDVVIAHTTPIRDFVVRFRDELFPDAAVVFLGLGPLDDATRASGAGITGVDTATGLRDTLELALRLHPGTSRVHVLTRALDGRFSLSVRAALAPFARRVQLSYVTDVPVAQLLARLRTLPAGDLVLYVQYSADEPGTRESQTTIAQRIGDAASVPVYGVYEAQVGTGVVGGIVRSNRSIGLQLGHLALRVLAGERAGDIAVSPVHGTPIFDSRQLALWGVADSWLPPGTEIRFREPTAWSRYRGAILATISLIALETASIVGLVIQRRRRRASEQALRASQDRYAMATSAGGVAVWDWDVPRDRLSVDPALPALLGYHAEDIDGRPEAWAYLVHPDDRESLAARVRLHLDGDAASAELEHRMLHRDGTARWFLVRASTTREAGRVRRVLGTSTDITERKRIEHDLHDATDGLARAARLSALGEFAASIAHEVRQPLTAIMTSARAALRYLSAGAGDDAREALTYVLTAGRRAGEVIERNRELFRSRTVQKEVLDLNAVVSEALVMVRARLEAGRVSVRTRLTEPLPAIAGDRIQLQQVLLNLFINAVDAMDGVAPHARRLDVDTACGGDAVRVSVRDHGVGLDGVDVDRLFTLSYTTKATGTGVGLSISRSIIEAHGGTVTAAANTGRGATFTFTLPAVTELQR
jgi:PAS domain S-box-containing protein